MKLNNLIAKGEFIEVYEDGGKAVKVFSPDMPKNKQKAFNEAMVHATIEATGLSIPTIYGVESVPEKDGAWAIIMDAVKGKTLTQLMAENPDKMDEYLDTMVNLQLEIHSKTVYHIGKLKDKLTRQINRLDDIGEVRKYELLTKLAGMPKHLKLCHNNFTPDNIIIDDDGKVTIIDWVAAKQGNASADVAKTYLMLSLDHPEAADKYLDKFCEKTKTKKEYVTGWLPIVAAARLTEKVEREKDLLLKWIDVANYE